MQNNACLNRSLAHFQNIFPSLTLPKYPASPLSLEETLNVLLIPLSFLPTLSQFPPLLPCKLP